MNRSPIVWATGLLLVLSTFMAWSRGAASAEQPVRKSGGAPGEALAAAFPGLASSGLTHARLADLPKGVLLKAGELTVTESQLEEETAKAPAEVKGQLRKYAFFMLEQMATQRLLLQAAKRYEAEEHAALPGKSDSEVIQAYVAKMLGQPEVTDGELMEFYDLNKGMLGEAPFGQVRDQIKPFVLRQKAQAAGLEFVRALGRRTVIEVSTSWLKEQAPREMDNAVDKTRRSGRPSLVDFGATGCRPCDLMAPILEALRKKYAGRANVLFVHVREEPVLAARYGIESIPVQVFFDRTGKEVFRHTGFFPQADVEKQLAEMGVK